MALTFLGYCPSKHCYFKKRQNTYIFWRCPLTSQVPLSTQTWSFFAASQFLERRTGSIFAVSVAPIWPVIGDLSSWYMQTFHCFFKGKNYFLITLMLKEPKYWCWPIFTYPLYISSSYGHWSQVLAVWPPQFTISPNAVKRLLCVRMRETNPRRRRFLAALWLQCFLVPPLFHFQTLIWSFD